MAIFTPPAANSGQEWQTGLRGALTKLSGRRILIATVMILMILSWTLINTYRLDLPSPSTNRVSKGQPHMDITKAAQNETLGFAKIYYISMPHRTDRQDQMSLLASMTNLKIELQIGVNGSEMDSKAKPGDEARLNPGQWGCWRSHANFWQKVLNERIETALILEDDLDWDPNLHDIMEQLGNNMRKNTLRATGMSTYEKENAPYGLDWDILHLGICWDGWEPKKRYNLYEDPHAPGRSNLTDHFINQISDHNIKITDDTRHRLITPSWHPSCTNGYAVTYHGAKRLLYNIGGVEGNDLAVDEALADREKNGKIKGYTVLPPVMTAWKVNNERDSDIETVDGISSKGFKKEGSENLRESTRKIMEEELGNNLRGNKDYWY